MSIKDTAQQFIRANRRSRWAQALAAASDKYLRAWYNENFNDFSRNGEGFALETFGSFMGSRPTTIWDVGAHLGEWSNAALFIVPSATIHSFEVIPSIAARIEAKERRIVHNKGLSDHEGTAQIYHTPHSDMLNTFKPYLDDPSFKDATIISCEITTGDRLAQQIAPPEFVKIDVEGHETAVLRGFQDLIRSSNAPLMFQLEYGVTYLQPGSTLIDLYALLPGYSIGRLYPNYVDFKRYEYCDDHFRMGNMIAVRDDRLKQALSGR